MTEHRQPAGRTLRENVEARSQTVDLASLARAKRKGRVLTMRALEEVLLEALENILLQGAADPVLEPESLKSQAREELARLLDAHRKVLDDKSEAERGREALERQTAALRSELVRHEEELADERERGTVHVQLSESALRSLEVRLGALIERGSDGRQFSGTLSDSLAEYLEGQRERLRSRASPKTQRVETLEKRVHKLNDALAEAQGALERMVSEGSIDPGVKSVYSSVQGLAPSAPQFARKKELLQVVFVHNLRLRGRTVESEDVKGVSEELLRQLPRASKGTDSTIEGTA